MKTIKREAKLAKGFLVILKKKLNRDVLCRSVVFRRLMSLVFQKDDAAKELWGCFAQKLCKQKNFKLSSSICLPVGLHLLVPVGTMLSLKQDNSSSMSPSQEPVALRDSGEASGEEVDLETMDSDAEFDSEEPDPPQEAICDQDSQLAFDDIVDSQSQPAPLDDDEMLCGSQLAAPVDEDMEDSNPMLASDEGHAKSPLAASPPRTPKGIEPDDKKCVVIDDTPQKDSPLLTEAEVASKIREIQMALADAKKERMASTFGSIWCQTWSYSMLYVLRGREAWFISPKFSKTFLKALSRKNPWTSCNRLRKAAKALEKDSNENPILVMDSLPYGTDASETLPLPPAEMDLLASNFEATEPIIPSAPLAPRMNYQTHPQVFSLWKVLVLMVWVFLECCC